MRVDIVLKDDQATGALTRGVVKTILTRGDHPRGIKVQLEDGQVGRVQNVLPITKNDYSDAKRGGRQAGDRGLQQRQ